MGAALTLYIPDTFYKCKSLTKYNKYMKNQFKQENKKKRLGKSNKIKDKKRKNNKGAGNKNRAQGD